MTKLEMAEKRIEEMKERRAYFAEMFAKTNKMIYKKMAESETEMIEEVRAAISDEVIKMARKARMA